MGIYGDLPIKHGDSPLLEKQPGWRIFLETPPPIFRDPESELGTLEPLKKSLLMASCWGLYSLINRFFCGL